MKICEGSERINGVVMQEIKVVSAMINEKCDSSSAVDENGGSVVKDVVGDKEIENGMWEIRTNETVRVNRESTDGDCGNVEEGCKHQFMVGDLVWGKIKNYPLWPGLIYDPSDASDLALKFKSENKLLVAYFGDGSCAWCSPSQLVPFVENYETMAKQSSSKSFVCGVEDALVELGRRVELKMYCCCVPEGRLTDLPRPEAANAGVRSGVLVPNGASDELPFHRCEPADILEYVRTIAVSCLVTNSLELVLMKSWLSAFGCVKKGCFPIYQEPQLIEGLEDKSISVVPDTNDFSIPVVVPIEGPSEEALGGSQKTLPIKGLMVTSTQKRKQKSVAKLMRESIGVKPKDKRKRKITGEAPTAAKNKKAANDDEKIEDPIDVVEEDSIDDVEEDSEEKTLKTFISRERKNSKYLSAPYTIPSPDLSRSYSRSYPRTKSDKIAKSSKVGDRLAKVAGHLISSARLTKCNSGTSKEKVSRNCLKLGAYVTNPQTINEKTKENCSMDISAYSDQVLASVQCAGVDFMSMDRSAIELLREFMSAFRSSKFLDASSYKLLNDQKSRKKRKSSVLEPVDVGNDLNNASVVSSQPVGGSEMIDKPKSRETKHKKDARAAPANKKEIDKSAPDALIISFGSNDLPSKDEIIKTLSKVASINEDATKLIHDLNSAMIVFINTSDAELAFRECIKQGPFSGNDIRYDLQYSSDASRMLESSKTTSKSPKKISLKHSVSVQPTFEDVSQVVFVRQKLKYLTSLLNQCDGKISLEEKSNLEDELRSMIQMVGEFAVKA